MSIDQVLTQINVSTLSLAEQGGVRDWLAERPYMQASIESALRRACSVKVILLDHKRQLSYAVRITD